MANAAAWDAKRICTVMAILKFRIPDSAPELDALLVVHEVNWDKSFAWNDKYTALVAECIAPDRKRSELSQCLISINRIAGWYVVRLQPSQPIRDDQIPVFETWANNFIVELVRRYPVLKEIQLELEHSHE